ncbi:MAG: PspC domain-containing protein [Corynebacterium sp.]|uniref:PspC domain-containing protein n=1 Tax=Corynebacterium sp. TaxID=1720 RepID=UPI0026DC0993|nr:PspC domain-containing protein [Corynebacterium sp.]MDO5098929.1 PspC domain-containing protein [Corynebacterium sp.]
MSQPFSPQPYAQRPLHRSLHTRLVGGVFGGVAETYGWNVTLLRVLFLLSMFLPGPQVLAYIAAWIIMPEG